MYSDNDTLAGRFPHSEISGSKLICQLPEAYRRLSRLSSPIIAKASTTCSYSLDPITLTSVARPHRLIKESIGLSPIALCRNSRLIRIAAARATAENNRQLLEVRLSSSFVLTQSKLLLTAR